MAGAGTTTTSDADGGTSAVGAAGWDSGCDRAGGGCGCALDGVDTSRLGGGGGASEIDCVTHRAERASRAGGSSAWCGTSARAQPTRSGPVLLDHTPANKPGVEAVDSNELVAGANRQ